MGETLKQRIYRMGQDENAIIQAYASDIIEILEEDKKEIEKKKREFETYLVYIELLEYFFSVSNEILENTYEFSSKCGCRYVNNIWEKCKYHQIYSAVEYMKLIKPKEILK